ncbi:MAG: 16S rRNA (guanine(966)-N(2))-methyltransferase RsmD [bacterium]|jgi:16S rRNA (guanine(966)-N(2))-methyltransferase RsmD
MLRIISGELGGRAIKTPTGRGTRPPLTRVRKAVFDVLRPYLDGACVLDLFAGSGSYVFEALSNGARRATAVELSLAAAAVLEENADVLGVKDRVRIFRGDAFQAIPRFFEEKLKFDVIFVAPPQRRMMVERTLDALRRHPLMEDESLIVCQFGTAEVGGLDRLPFWEWQRKTYGNTEVAYLGMETAHRA